MRKLDQALAGEGRTALDVLHVHKDALCKHLMEGYRSWFGVRFEFLLYDVTSTYFEGQTKKNKKAAHGYSRDKRPTVSRCASAWL